MKMSIEMKIQALDKMLEIRNQLVITQDNLGVYNGFDKESNILIYSTKEFIEVARYLNANIALKNANEKYMHLTFNYNGTEFVTYILPCEYEEYKSEIAVEGGENV